jgi:hypothetical protein
MGPILNRYIFRETAVMWLAVTGVLLLVLLTDQFARVLDDAAGAELPKNAIFAVSYRKTPQPFPMRWRRNTRYIYTVNVTDRYAGKLPELADGQVRVMFRVVASAGGDRVPAAIRVETSEGELLLEGKTKDERFDLNDHLVAVLPRDTTLRVEIRHGASVLKTEVIPESKGQLFSFDISEGKPVRSSRYELGDDARQFASTETGQAIAGQFAEYFSKPAEERAKFAWND